jgi:Na+/H+ antiporter NhaC
LNTQLKNLLFYVTLFGAFVFLSLLQSKHDSFGVYSLLPVILTVIIAISTKKALEAIVAGVIAGLLLLDPASLFSQLGVISTNVLRNETIVWIILVCGMMGGLITMLERGGSVNSFSSFLSTRIKTKKATLMTTSVLGIFVFIDDYLNSLAVSTSMKSMTDKFNISREKLAFIVDSTAAPICILVPISTWAVFFAALLEENNAVEQGGGMSLYIESIPYMAYGWMALLVVWLVAFGILKDFGEMKKAEERAQAGQTIPNGVQTDGFDTTTVQKSSPIMGLLNFFLPMTVLVLASLYYDIDLLLGALVASAFTMIFYYLQNLLNFNQLVTSMIDGFKIMLHPLAVVCAGFMLKEVNDALGLTPYIMELITPYLSKEYFPAIIFIVMALVVFGTSSSWGVFVIALPIIIPLAQNLEMHMPLVVGALLSASAFGSHACFYSDSTVLSAQGSGCTPMQHALTQIPYATIGAIISLFILLLMGHYFA